MLKKLWFLSLFFLLYLLNFSHGQTDVYDVIMQNIQLNQKKVNVQYINQQTEQWLNMMQANGSFADIDYLNRSRTAWQPLTHLQRVQQLALGYTMQESAHFGEERLYIAIVNMLNFWHNQDPRSDNWYMQRIAAPQQMGVILILLRSGAKPIPAELEAKLIERMKIVGGAPDKRGTSNTGANKLDMAIHWVYRGLLTKDVAVLSKGVEQAFLPLILTTAEGFQHDYSFQQHGPQLYIRGYGSVMLHGVMLLAQYLTGTQYALSGEKLKVLSDFVLNSYLPTIRGKYYMFNTTGRGLARVNALYASECVGLLDKLSLLDTANMASYQIAKLRIEGQQPVDYGVKPAHLHYWRSDYTFHQRPDYAFDVRLASTFTHRSEIVNEENSKGYFLTDGATEIAMQGDEYVNIFPLWNWAKIPGTTAPDLSVDKIPRPKTKKENLGSSPFAGGVTTGLYGITAYHLKDNTHKATQLEAKKSWFFFDKEIVCLGAGITSKNQVNAPIHTTVNQTLLKGDVSTILSNGSLQTFRLGEFGYTGNLRWALHNGIGYFFPQQEKVIILNQPRSGNWNTISPVNQESSGELFSIWLDHGLHPNHAGYAYVVVPAIHTVTEAEQHPIHHIEILENSENVQAVRHTDLDMLGVIFYNKSTFTYQEEFSITVSKPCIVMITNIKSENPTLYVADPSRKQKSIQLAVKLEGMKEVQDIKCSLPKEESHAGSTQVFNLVK